MPKSVTSTNTSTEMSTGLKMLLLVVGAYVAAMGMTALTSLAIVLLMRPHTCSDAIRALSVLLGTIAAVFLASVAVVGVLSRKIVAGAARRWGIVIVYGMLMLVSDVAIAFVLMVVFNC